MTDAPAVTEQQLRDIKQGIANAQSRQSRAAFEAENAQASVDRASAQLREEFAVESAEDARRVYSELQAELAIRAKAVETALERTHS